MNYKQLHNLQVADDESENGTNLTKRAKEKAEIQEKISNNEAKLSFSEAISNDTKLKNLTKVFYDKIHDQHPSYKRGYNPRHFNHLKSSHAYTSENALNTAVAPQYLLNNNQHLNPNFLTKQSFFNINHI